MKQPELRTARAGRPRWAGRFEEEAADPLASLGNLADVMLVFVCGLIAALVAAGGAALPSPSKASAPAGDPKPREVDKGRELPELPPSLQGDGSGYESVGRVYRDANTGKLILVGDDPKETQRRP